MRLRLYENHRFALYAPFYVAHAIGAYSTEGLAVELLLSPGMGLAEQALLERVSRCPLGGADARHEAPRSESQLSTCLLC